MGRADKRSRMRGLPPRVRVQEGVDNLTGSSVPPVPRTNFQGQNPGSSGTWFDDTRALTWGQAPKSLRFLWGTQIQSGSWYVTNNELLTSMSLVASDPAGRLVKGVSDTWLPQAPPGPGTRRVPAWTPFVEWNLHGPDGKTSQDEFYATGSLLSEVGEGFSAPVWSKTKIEISMPQNHSLSLQITSGSGEERLMAYYDWGSGRFGVVGPTKRMDEYYQNVVDGAATLGLYFGEKVVGFGPSVNSRGASTSEIKNYGVPVQSFGFPWHQKFLPPSQSMWFSMTGSLVAPFLLEKAVLTFSGAYSPRSYSVGSDGFLGQVTWCLLNYHKVGKVQVVDAVTLPGTQTATTALTAINSGYAHGQGNLDLVTVLQVSAKFDGSGSQAVQLGYAKELTLTSSATGWSGTHKVQGVVKVPGKYPTAAVVFLPTGTAAGLTGNSANWTSHKMDNVFSGRTGLSLANGRNYLNQVSGIGEPEPQTFDNSGLRWSSTPYRTNPYWLLPEDNLVVAVQLPFPGDWRNFGVGGTTQGPSFTVPEGTVVTLTLYGSYVEEDEEAHDLGTGVATTSVFEPVVGRHLS